MEHVQSSNSLGYEAVPEVDGEGFVRAGKDADEVVLEGLDCSFSCVAAMGVGRDQLVFDVLFADVVEYGLRGFIVHALEDWFEAAGSE